MNINNLEVWVIDQFEYNSDSFIINDLAQAVGLETIVESTSPNKSQVAIRSFDINSLIRIDDTWTVFKNDTPFVLFVDTDRDTALHKTRFSKENIEAIGKLAGRIFSKYNFNENLGEYLNEFSIPVPRVLFRDQNTGLIQIAQNTFTNLPGQLFSLIQKPVFAVATGALLIGAATSKNNIARFLFLIGAGISGREYFKE